MEKRPVTARSTLARPATATPEMAKRQSMAVRIEICVFHGFELMGFKVGGSVKRPGTSRGSCVLWSLKPAFLTLFSANRVRVIVRIRPARPDEPVSADCLQNKDNFLTLRDPAATGAPRYRPLF